MSSNSIQITIWMNMPSFYQVDLFQELALLEDIELNVIFARTISVDRTGLGWQSEFDDQLNITFLNPVCPIMDAVRLAWKQRKRIHIVNGIWSEVPFLVALLVLSRFCRHYFIYSEAPNPFSKDNVLKHALLKLITGILVRPDRAALLAVSKFAREFYQRYGFSLATIYCFAYFRNTVQIDPIPATYSEKLHIIYVGQLIQRKRVDLLLSAASTLRRNSFSVTIIGEGAEKDQLIKQTRSLKLDPFVRFIGVVSSDDVPRLISKASVLVLPSDYDGWGLVVNEALMVGTPVIVSDGCGAAEVIQPGKNGFTFERGNVLALRSALQLIQETDIIELRHNALATGLLLSTKGACEYLKSCIQHKLDHNRPKPTPKWRNS